MPGFSLLDVQSALFQALSTDAALQEIGWDVLDYVEERRQPPYIVLDSETAVDNSAKDTNGLVVESTIDFWSDRRGFLQLKTAMQRVYDILHFQWLYIPGTTSYLRPRISYLSVVRDEEGVKRHGIMRAEFLTHDGYTKQGPPP